MSKIWTQPKVWAIGESVNDLKMQDVSNNMEWLKDRPYNNIHSNGGNTVQATTGTPNWFAANDALYTLTVTTAAANEKLLIGFRGIFATNGAIGSGFWYDLLMDGTTWLSTMSGTPSTGHGLGEFIQMTALNLGNEFSHFAIAVIPTAGTHTFALRIGGTNAVTVTLFANTTSF